MNETGFWRDELSPIENKVNTTYISAPFQR